MRRDVAAKARPGSVRSVVAVCGMMRHNQAQPEIKLFVCVASVLFSLYTTKQGPGT